MSDNLDTVSAESGHKVVFKKKTRLGQRRQRQTPTDEDDNEDESVVESTDEWNRLSELRETQNQRKRCTKGIDILELTQRPIASNNNNKIDTKSGTTSDVKMLTSELDLGNTFSVETNRRDEDKDLMKYIEEELALRKGVANSSDADNKLSFAAVNVANDMNQLFDVLPEHLIQTNAKKSEEMLSNQMLNGIPEIELGLEEKIRNIEATEEAKTKMLSNRLNRNRNDSSFVPNNIAVCFVQHNRYNVSDHTPRLDSQVKRQQAQQKAQPVNTYVEEPVVVIGDEPKQMVRLQKQSWDQRNKTCPKDKASDDFFFEKFRKQFRKF